MVCMDGMDRVDAWCGAGRGSAEDTLGDSFAWRRADIRGVDSPLVAPAVVAPADDVRDAGPMWAHGEE